MAPDINVSLSRLDIVYLARVADQAERYNDVVAQFKSLISSGDTQLTVEERNLLSIAWRVIDTLEKRPGMSQQHKSLMRVQKSRIKHDLDETCKDVVTVMEKHLIPAANDGEEMVFYCKMRGDYYRYLAEFSTDEEREQHSQAALESYKSAYKHASVTLSPTHPTKLGLALNFAVYYHDIGDSPERACFLAKHAFDEAIATVTKAAISEQVVMEDSLMILQLLRDDMILWSSEIS
ncbi:14-3-3-like protein [Cristinia sonorae]|uniref:14-3-3-like protein n=1 Tax=Cristinia sonorae TaxID=1940300 RepID=A0A8K0UVS1_9AGAR|nr:14-3-3-like protein [Cristinia sonorae]